MNEYDIIMAFVDWCEKHEKTEWMGYNGMSIKVVTDYLDEKRKNTLTPAKV